MIVDASRTYSHLLLQEWLDTVHTQRLSITGHSSPSEPSSQLCLFSSDCPSTQGSSMISQNMIDAQDLTTRERLKSWIAAPAGVTRGWLLLSILLGWVFLGFAIYAAVQTVKIDNRVTQAQIEASLQEQVNSCLEANSRRAESKIVATAAVTGDRAIWESIDELLEGGIPEPARSVIFDGLDQRLVQIETTYTQSDCMQITLD